MPAGIKTGFVHKVREAFDKVKEPLTNKALVEMFDLPPSQAVQVATAINHLRKNKEIEVVSGKRGSHDVAYAKVKAPPAPAPTPKAPSKPATGGTGARTQVELDIEQILSRAVMLSVERALDQWGVREKIAALERDLAQFKRDAELVLEGLTAPAPPAPPAEAPAPKADLVAAYDAKPENDARPRRTRITVVGLEGAKQGRLAEEFPELDLRFVGPDDTNHSGVEGTVAGSAAVIAMSKWIPHSLLGKIQHKRLLKATGMAELKAQLEEFRA